MLFAALKMLHFLKRSLSVKVMNLNMISSDGPNITRRICIVIKFLDQKILFPVSYWYTFMDQKIYPNRVFVYILLVLLNRSEDVFD